MDTQNDKMSETVFRRVNADDYQAMMVLQDQNLVTNLTEDQKKDGYLSVLWTAEQIADADKNLAVIVAKQDGYLAGYMVATQCEYNERIPIVQCMMNLYDTLTYKGKSLSSYRSFIYGPACVAKECRGTGVLEGLFSQLLHEVAGQYDVGVAFIGTNNERSIRAHKEKLGMEQVGAFSFNGKEFHVVAFSVP